MSYYSELIMGTAGIVSYWRLGESDGTVAVDEMGSNNGTYTGGVTLGADGAIPTDSNTAAQFAIGGYVKKVSASFAITVGTIEAWIKIPISATDGLSTFGGLRRSQSLGAVFLTMRNTGFKLRVEANTAGGLAVFESAANAIVPGVFQHIVCTYDGTTLIGYINVVAVGSSVSGSGNLSWAGENADYTWGGDNAFGGTNDEVAIFNSVLSTAQIAAHYESGANLRRMTRRYDLVSK